MPSIEWVSFRESLDEFAFQMQVQLDLTTEAENMLQFGKDYEKSNVIFPSQSLNTTIHLYRYREPLNTTIFTEHDH